MDTLHTKYNALRSRLTELGSLAVAFSGGVDSTFLLQVAYNCLGNRALAVTAAPPFVPIREQKEASDFCREAGIRQIVIPPEALDIDRIRHNPPDRCYHCKHMIFGRIIEAAEQNGIYHVAEGSNTDDTGDYRPGMRAIRELGVLSPLLDAGLSKSDIRTLSKELGLSTWDKPSFACLASRFVYGEAITDDRLSMVDRAEQFLLDLGFRQFRVRIHGDLARIEILPDDFDRIMTSAVREQITAALKGFGFSYVTLDLSGYRTGSMNEVLKR